jgi:hypothetical protein
MDKNLIFRMRTECWNELCPVPVYTPRNGNESLPCPLDK